MCLESANYVLNDNALRFFWYLDRWTFPLFSFALAVHIARGFDFRGQVISLLILGALTQPIYSAAFVEAAQVNIFITLAIGGAIAGALAARPPWMSDAALGVAALVTVAFPGWTYHWEYGLMGAVLPLAMTVALRSWGVRMAWPVVIIALTYLSFRYGTEDWVNTVAIELGVAILGSAILIGLVPAMLAERARFLPRYALHVVYPGHLALILVVQRFLQAE